MNRATPTDIAALRAALKTGAIKAAVMAALGHDLPSASGADHDRFR
jgi:hypothetical protein